MSRREGRREGGREGVQVWRWKRVLSSHTCSIVMLSDVTSPGMRVGSDFSLGNGDMEIREDTVTGIKLYIWKWNLLFLLLVPILQKSIHQFFLVEKNVYIQTVFTCVHTYIQTYSVCKHTHIHVHTTADGMPYVPLSGQLYPE